MLPYGELCEVEVTSKNKLGLLLAFIPASLTILPHSWQCLLEKGPRLEYRGCWLTRMDGGAVRAM